MQELAGLSIFTLALPLLAMIILTSFLLNFVALKAPPTERAAWTVGSAYLVTVIFVAFGGSPEGRWWAAPLEAAPAALVVFWWRRRELRSAWYESDEEMPPGVRPANDDWRLALIAFAGAAGLLVLKFVLREL